MPNMTLRDDGLILHALYDFIPDRTDDRFLFCSICDPETFFCPIGQPDLLLAHYAETGHDQVKVEEAHGIPEMEAVGAVRAISCKTCGYTAASKSDLMKHIWREHKRKAPGPALAVTVMAETPPASVTSRVTSFLKRLP